MRGPAVTGGGSKWVADDKEMPLGVVKLRRRTPGWTYRGIDFKDVPATVAQDMTRDPRLEAFEDAMMEVVNAVNARLGTRLDLLSIFLTDPRMKRYSHFHTGEWHRDASTPNTFTLLIGLTPNALSTQFQAEDRVTTLIDGGDSSIGDAALFDATVTHRVHHLEEEQGPESADRGTIIVRFFFNDVVPVVPSPAPTINV